jgi:hypothetical protein
MRYHRRHYPTRDPTERGKEEKVGWGEAGEEVDVDGVT